MEQPNNTSFAFQKNFWIALTHTQDQLKLKFYL